MTANRSGIVRWYLRYAALVLALGVGIGMLLVAFPAGPPNLGWYFVANAGFFYLLSMMTFMGLAIGMRHPSQSRFLMAFMGAFFVQLIAGAVFCVLAVHLYNVWIDWFFLPFGLCYIAFTILKVIALVRMAEAQKSKPS